MDSGILKRELMFAKNGKNIDENDLTFNLEELFAIQKTEYSQIGDIYNEGNSRTVFVLQNEKNLFVIPAEEGMEKTFSKLVKSLKLAVVKHDYTKIQQLVERSEFLDFLSEEKVIQLCAVSWYISL